MTPQDKLNFAHDFFISMCFGEQVGPYDESNGEGRYLDNLGVYWECLTEESRKHIFSIVVRFLAKAWPYLSDCEDMEQAAYDLYFDYVGHGVGFADRSLKHADLLARIAYELDGVACLSCWIDETTIPTTLVVQEG